MTTITEQLEALTKTSDEDAKADYIKLLRLSGTDDLDAEHLHEIVRTCKAVGVELKEFERDRHIAAMVYVGQDKAETEAYHRELCKRISHQISDLRNSAPPDPRMRQKHTVKIRQALRLLALNQTGLHQAENARESLRKQGERFWWFNAFVSESTP